MFPAKRTSSAEARGPARVAQRYVVNQQIAAGGMGIVYHVVDSSTGEELALKRIQTDEPYHERTREAFEREYHVLRSLEHPRIIRVFDYGVDDQGPYYTMELLTGRDLRDEAPLDWKKTCLYLRDIATSLSLL